MRESRLVHLKGARGRALVASTSIAPSSSSFRCLRWCVWACPAPSPQTPRIFRAEGAWALAHFRPNARPTKSGERSGAQADPVVHRPLDRLGVPAARRGGRGGARMGANLHQGLPLRDIPRYIAPPRSSRPRGEEQPLGVPKLSIPGVPLGKWPPGPPNRALSGSTAACPRRDLEKDSHEACGRPVRGRGSNRAHREE